jgi:hypothetical protein
MRVIQYDSFASVHNLTKFCLLWLRNTEGRDVQGP